MALNFAAGENSGVQKWPSSILQTTYATSVGEEANSNSNYQTFINNTMTVLSSTSHKIIIVSAIRLVCHDMEANFRISDGLGSVTPRFRVNGLSNDTFNNPCLTWYWDQAHTAGQAITFSCQCRDGGGDSGNVIWGDNNAKSVMTVIEIEP